MKLRNQTMKLRNKKSLPNINVQETPSRKTTNKSTPSKSQQKRSENVSESSRNMVGVTKRKSGKYGVKIHDRIRKKDVWLGTFVSEEEASKVYWAKKIELEKEFEGVAKNVGPVVRGQKTSQFVGVSLRASGKFAAHIRDPIRKKKLYLGVFDSETKASEVYLAKKKELEEEVKANGVHWHLGREGKKGTSLMIRKRRNFGEEIEKRRNFGEVIEKGRNSGEENRKRRKIVKRGEFSEDDQESSMEIEYMDSSDGEGASTETGISGSSSIVEVSNGDDIQSLKESDHNDDSSNGESGPSKARVSEENSTILEENPCSENQESVKEDINHSATIHQDNVPIEAKAPDHDLGISKNAAAETEVINIDSIAEALIVNPCPAEIRGATILLRTKSGTPIMDSNGFLLGEWSWIDDMSLPSIM